LTTPNETHENAATVQVGCLVADAMGKYLGQPSDLGLWSSPVLSREKEDCQLLDSELYGVVKAGLEGIGACLMPLTDW
jgi:hypothetical protein